MKSTHWPMIALGMIIVFEYVGLGNYMSILSTLRIPMLITLMLLVWVFFKNNPVEMLRSTQFKIFLAFILLTFFSLFFATLRMRVLTSITTQVGYFALFFVAYFVFLDTKRIKGILFVLLVIHAYLVLVNLQILTSGIRRGSLHAGYFLGDGNDFAWSLTIFLPFSFYVLRESRGFAAIVLSGISGVICIVGIVLSGSRGGAIATFMSFSYLALQGKKRAMKVILLCVVAGVVLTIAPDYYLKRIESIGSYEEDSSARGRIMAWKAAMQMAIDHPLGVGAGNFPSVYGRFYRKDFADHTIYASNRWIKPHSIYFLVLAEYGFLGLGLLFVLIVSNLIQLSKAERILEGSHAVVTVPLSLVRSLKGSFVAFAIGGVFLGGFNYPHVYLLCALTLATGAIIQRPVRVGSNEP